MSYESFAKVYDGLQNDVDYVTRTEYLMKLFKKYDRLPTLMLDLACGTGGFSLEFIKSGIEVIGVDPSVEMLNRAREKCAEKNVDMLLLCQTAAKLDLYGTVDGAVCCLDSINHIIDEDELQQSFDKVSLFLEKDRLFIFDVNSLYKHEKVLSGNTFVGDSDGVFYTWRNSECDADGIVDIRLDFFCPTETGEYMRSVEEFSERAYSEKKLKNMLKNAGFEILAVLGDNSFEKPSKHEERIIFVARKK